MFNRSMFSREYFARAVREAHGIGATRLATFGLVSVLILLSGFAFWGALTAYRAGTAAKHFEELSDAFDGVRAAVASEESLERKYRLEPSAKVRQRHRAASDELLKELARAHVW
jgi:CHASE3 domain sensor protein